MPVNIGTGPEHTFEEPLGLLSDCHRRIERFLGVLARVADEVRGAPLNDDQRRAVLIALKYFREAAPKHTADEENSLFPRMRSCGGPEVEAALERVGALEGDHRRAEELHAETDKLFTEWLYEGRLNVEKDARLREAMAELLGIYGEHIRIEDEYVFPLAARTLDEETKAAIGREMAQRRGVITKLASDLVSPKDLASGQSRRS